MKTANRFFSLFFTLTVCIACRSPLANNKSPDAPELTIGLRAPVINKVEVLNHHTVRLHWTDDNKGVDFYAVLCGNNPQKIPAQPAQWGIDKKEITLSTLTANTTYYFWVMGYTGPYNAKSDYSISKPMSAVTQLAPPFLHIDESKTTASSFYLSWEPVSGADLYEIRYCIYPETLNEENWHKKTTRDTYMVMDGLAPDILFVFIIRAHGLTGNISNFSERTRPYRTRINPPTQIWAEDATPASLKVCWTDMSASGYVLKYRSDQNSIFSAFYVGATTHAFTFSNLKENAQHYFVLSARDFSGTESDEKHFSCYTLLSKIENLAAETVSESEVDLVWDRKNGADGYVLEVYGNDSSLLRKTPPGNMIRDNSYRVTNLSPNTQYFFVVRAVNEAAIGVNAANHVEGEPCDMVTARTLLPTPKKPVITNQQSTSIELSWQPPVAGADFYRLYYNTNDSLETSRYVDEITGTAFTVKNLDNDTTFYFWIQAFNNEQNYSLPGSSAEARTIISNISITFEDFACSDDPLLEKLPENLIRIDMESYTVTVQSNGWDETYSWFLNGIEDKSVTGNAYTVNVQQLTVGSYLLTVVAVKNGVPYAGSIRFKIQ